MSDTRSWATWYADDSRTVILNREWMPPVSENVLWSDGPVTDPENWEVISEDPGEQKPDHFLVISVVRPLTIS